MSFESTQPSLLSRVRDATDQTAWREFENKYRDLILRYCRARGLQAVDAEDVHQMVMINLAKSLRGFEYDPARGRFRDYLGRAVRNSITRHRSRPNPSPAALDTDMGPADPAEPDGEWEREWMDHHYRLAMSTVRATFEPQSVEVFDRLLGGDSIESLAQAYATTPAAVHKIKQRIRDRLKELIAAQIREEDLPDG